MNELDVENKKKDKLKCISRGKCVDNVCGLYKSEDTFPENILNLR